MKKHFLLLIIIFGAGILFPIVIRAACPTGCNSHWDCWNCCNENCTSVCGSRTCCDGCRTPSCDFSSAPPGYSGHCVCNDEPAVCSNRAMVCYVSGSCSAPPPDGGGGGGGGGCEGESRPRGSDDTKSCYGPGGYRDITKCPKACSDLSTSWDICYNCWRPYCRSDALCTCICDPGFCSVSGRANVGPKGCGTECTPGSGPCCDETGHFRPSTHVCSVWYEFKCSGTNCGDDPQRQKLKRYCKDPSQKDVNCTGNIETIEPWANIQDCQSWQVCATSTATNFKCEEPPEKCEFECDGGTKKNNGATPCQPVDPPITKPVSSEADPPPTSPLNCFCWGKCLDPITNPHYYDGVRELPLDKPEDFENLPKEKQAWRENIFLPVKFGWDMNVRGWNTTTTDDPNGLQSPMSLKVKIDSVNKFLTIDELLYGDRKKELEDLRKKAGNSDEDFKKFLNYLKIFSKDPLINKLLASQQERDRFRQDSQFGQKLDQLIYFIYFKDGTRFTYSPSQDKSVGPCKLNPNQSYNWKVKMCCDKEPKNCGPPNLEEISEEIRDPKNWGFTTANAPELLDILEIHFKELKIEKIGDNILKKEFIASSTRWIDTDWNGPKYQNINGDYVDFEWCSMGVNYYRLRAFYKGEVEIGAGEKEEEKVTETGLATCVDPNAPCLCETEPCKCNDIPPIEEAKCEKPKTLDDIDICHPILWTSAEISRLRWPPEILDEGEEKAREKIQKTMEQYCWGKPHLKTFYMKLAEKETITLDWLDNPYEGAPRVPKEINTSDLWKWDIQNEFFASNAIWGWEVSASRDGTNWTEYSQRWHFKYLPLPKLKEEVKLKLDPVSLKNESDSMTAINRIQHLLFNMTPRTLSYKIRIFDEKGKALPLPKNLTLIIRRLKAMGTGESLWKGITAWELWPCLKQTDAKEGEEINDYRLNRKFTLEIASCFDEMAKKCDSGLTFRFPIIVTGAKPTGLTPGSINPPPLIKVKIPLYLEWDDMPGAASYYYEITGPTQLKGLVPTNSRVWAELKEDGEYHWRVRTCADLCDDETMLQCGTSSDEMIFYGCQLIPPENHSPENAAEFFPEETINLSWDSIPCAEFYQYKVDYAVPFVYEFRDECEPREVIPPTIIDTNQVLLPTDFTKCYGTYHWQIRGCIDENCQEAGDWSGIWYFNVVKEKLPRGGISGGGGFGKCRNLIPCQDCHLIHIPMLIENIINCILWTLTPIALVLLTAYTGVVFYFSFGAPETLTKVKSIWKSVGWGFLAMFLAWAILNFIFTFLGYRRTFGDWWNPL